MNGALSAVENRKVERVDIEGAGAVARLEVTRRWRMISEHTFVRLWTRVDKVDSTR